MKLFQILNKQGFVLLIIFTVLAFFYKRVLSGLVPFPGDLLVANHEPYRSYQNLGYAPGTVTHKAQGPDVIKQLLPWKHFVVDSYKNSQIPLWNPYNFSGNPLLANFQSGVFYPLNLVFLLLNFELSWSLFIILQPLLAALFTYLFLRRLKVSEVSSVFGSISYAFSLYMVVWMQYGNIGHTLIWLPLVLYFTDKLIEKPNAKIFLLLVISSVMSFFAGYIQGYFYVHAMAIIYFLLKGFLEKKIKLGGSIIFSLALIFPALIAAFQLLPTLELFATSTRGNYSLSDIEKLLNPFWYMVTIFAPDFFGNPASRNFWFDGTYIERASYFGLYAVVLAIFAMITLRKRTEVKIFSLMFVLTLILTTDLFLTKYFYLIPIPVISTTVPTRLLSLFAFSGSVLSAFGLDHLLSLKSKKTIVILAGGVLAGLIALLVFSLINGGDFDVTKKNLLLPLVSLSILFFMIFILFAKIKLIGTYKKPLFILVLLLIGFFDLFYYFNKITPFAPKEFMYPETPISKFLKENSGIYRSWGYGTAYVDSNFQTFDKLYAVDGSDPLHLKEYTELVESSKDGEIPRHLPRPDANIASGYGKDDLPNNLYRQKILNILGVKYVLNKDESINGDHNPDEVTFRKDNYKLVWQMGYWQIYENLKVSPRFFATNKYRVVSEKDAALKTIYDKDFQETDELVLLKDPEIELGSSAATMKLLSYSPNKVSFSIEGEENVLAYLSDNYYQGWEARVDGNIKEIYLANYSFRAVPVEKGKHTLVFEYKPKSFQMGLYISLSSLLGLLIVFVTIKKYEK